MPIASIPEEIIDPEIRRVEVACGQLFTISLNSEEGKFQRWAPYFPTDPIQYTGYSSGPDEEQEGVRITSSYFVCVVSGMHELLLFLEEHTPDATPTDRFLRAIRYEIVVA